jgi:DNA-directed RNA polymerase specialized sigma24 family protein
VFVDITNSEYNKLLDIAKNICKTEMADDLLHECILAMYQYPKEELQSIKENGRLFFFGARIMANMYHSKTSRFYYKIKKYGTQHIDYTRTNLDDFIFTNSTADNSIEKIMTILDDIYWYDRELFKLYYFGTNEGTKYTYTSLSEKTGISRRSIFYTIKNVKEHIKNKIDESE